MKTKRRFTLGLAAAAMAVLMLIGFTVAYLTDSRSTLNVLGIGEDENGNSTVKITLTEPMFGQEADDTQLMNPGEADEYEYAKLYNILPGQEINKDPTVTNVGAEAVYVRVRFTDENNTPVDITAAPFSLFGVQVDSTNWALGGDGYYYYSTNGTTCAQMAVNDSVRVLKEFTGATSNKYTMKLPASMDNTTLAPYLGEVNFQVNAEAIQTRGFTPGAISSANPWTMEDGTTPVTIIPAIR